jgi:hypothetical protein
MNSLIQYFKICTGCPRKLIPTVRREIPKTTIPEIGGRDKQINFRWPCCRIVCAVRVMWENQAFQIFFRLKRWRQYVPPKRWYVPLQVHTVLQFRKSSWTSSPPWEPQISHPSVWRCVTYAVQKESLNKQRNRISDIGRRYMDLSVCNRS